MHVWQRLMLNKKLARTHKNVLGYMFQISTPDLPVFGLQDLCFVVLICERDQNALADSKWTSFSNHRHAWSGHLDFMKTIKISFRRWSYDAEGI